MPAPVRTEAFDEAFAKLNAEQKKAVETTEGPVFVIAGPGTGKTQVLTLRIANILRTTDTPPDAILALTFTEAGAREMRERLAKIIGAAAYRVRLYTYHGFCEAVIAQFPDQFPRIIGAQVASDAERAEILDRALLSANVQHMRPFGDPLYYHPAASRAIATMKRENITPDTLEALLVENEQSFETTEGKVHEKGKYAGKMKGEFVTLQKKIERTRDLLAVYRAYEAGLTETRRYDFEDVILEVLLALDANEDFRLQVQESLLYILADEHQDANRAQNALLENVSGFFDRPNLFIVGDEKQAIYRFQGADLDTVHYFQSRFSDTNIIALIENYRSTQTILDTALSLVAASPDERLSRARLLALRSVDQRPIRIISCPTPESEIATLAVHIRQALEEGVAPGDIAVLVRRNRDVVEVAEGLTRAGILVTGAGESNALHNRFVESLVRLLIAINEPRDEYLAGSLTLPGFPLSAADIWRITHAARKDKVTIRSIIASEEVLLGAGVKDVEKTRALGARLEALTRLASYARPAEVAEEALRASGLLPRILASSDRAESLAAIRALLYTFEELSRREHGAGLSRALALLELYEARGMQLSGRGSSDPTRVKVLTVHRSKGREFSRVFMPKLTESAWSTRSRAEYFHLPGILSGSVELEDERRLLYVGITRAKEHATLLYALEKNEGRADMPSALLEDLDPALVEICTAEVIQEDPLERELPTRYAEGSGPSEDDLATLRAALFAQGISPTALNNYLECPWKYFYVNLLRLPEAENKFMLFGTAVHASLKVYADARARGIDIGAQGIIEAFSRSLDRAPLSERDLKEMYTKGERALAVWWDERHASWPARSSAEQPIEAYVSLGTLSEEVLRIRGVLDRVDDVPGGVHVIDYKTGKPRSRNEIKGTTKSSDGDYYRQLTFYTLLLARSEVPLSIAPIGTPLREGIIEFVEPDDAGRIHTEAFDVPNEDVIALEQLIRTTAYEISTLSFWNNPCSEVNCRWCGIRFGIDR